MNKMVTACSPHAASKATPSLKPNNASNIKRQQLKTGRQENPQFQKAVMSKQQ